MDFGYNFELKPIRTPGGAIMMVVGNNCGYYLSSLHHHFLFIYLFVAPIASRPSIFKHTLVIPILKQNIF